LINGFISGQQSRSEAACTRRTSTHRWTNIKPVYQTFDTLTGTASNWLNDFLLRHLSSLLQQTHTISHSVNFSVYLMWVDFYQWTEWS